MPATVRSSTALLASALHALFVLSHALQHDLGQAFDSWGEFKLLTPGWIISAKYPAPSSRQKLEHENSGAIRHGRNALRRYRCLDSTRRRSKSCIVPLSATGLEDSVPSSATAVSTSVSSSTSTASAILSGSSTSSAQPTATPFQSLQTGASTVAHTKRTSVGDERGRTTNHESPPNKATRSMLSTTRSSAVSPTQATVSSPTNTADPVLVDEGEAIYQRLEGITRYVEVGSQRVLLRVANLDDYLAIADVRFSVFSPVHVTLKHRFRERSCVLIKERRRRGAFCIVAVEDSVDKPPDPQDVDVPAEGGDKAGRKSHPGNNLRILGTLECSKHEFEDTPLAPEGDGTSRLYLTEVAVREECRRMGLGKSLLGMVDDVARHLDTREVYLHVNEINEAAVNLYTRCGYEDAPNCPSSRVFTNKLGLSGGFYGQRHRLMRKIIAPAEDERRASPPVE